MGRLAASQDHAAGSLTPFVGREREAGRLLSLLGNPACRLIAIVGPGGVGKTRLASEVLRIAEVSGSPRSADGVYVLTLDTLSTAEPPEATLVAAIARALSLRLAGPESTAVQVRHYLRAKTMLLLLDGFEPLRMAAPFLATLLQEAPGLTLLVTSREQLRLRGAWTLVLEGLPYTEPVATEPACPDPPALQLFAQLARMHDPGFALTSAVRPAVARICELVSGLPLALELAASWTGVLSCPELAELLAQNLDLLAGSLPDLPPRQQSLRMVFASSWQVLAPPEQEALRRLAVFRGSFTREAAATVAGVALPMLATLLHKSLVYRLECKPGGAVRYGLRDVLRPYVLERLEQAGEAHIFQERRARYYCALLATQTAALRGADQQAALATVGSELAQFRVAWQWAVATASPDALAQATHGLFHYYDMSSSFREGVEAFAAAAAALAPAADDPETLRVYAVVLARQAWFVFHEGQQRQARELLERSVALLRAAGAQSDLVFSLNYLGAVCAYLGDYTATRTLCQEGLALARQLDDHYGSAVACNILGQAAYSQGEYAAAQNWSEQSLAIETRMGNRWSMAFSLTNLGKVGYVTGAYAQARAYFEESLHIRHALGDTRGVAICYAWLGDTAVGMGAYHEAQTWYEQSMRLFRSIGNQWGVITARISLAHLALVGKDRTAALLLLHEALRSAVAIESLPQIVTILATCTPLIRDQGELAWAAALTALLDSAPATLEPYLPHAQRLLLWMGSAEFRQGQDGLAADGHTSQALAPVTPSVPAVAPAARTAYPAGLTGREVEVLQLVAQGLTDAQVADRLIISRRTVSTHLSAIYGKIQVSSRSAATRFAIEHGLA